MKPIYDFAKKEELELIHEYSMKLLKETGVVFYCDEVIQIFKEHGFKVEGNTVYMEEKDIMNALKTVPKEFEWYGRGSQVTLGGGKTVCAPCYGPMYILQDGEFHTPNIVDYNNFAKLDATSKVLDVSNPNMMDLSFMPSDVASNCAMATVLMHNERPAIGMVDGKQNAVDSIQMTREFYDVHDKTVVCGLINVASPCVYSQAMSEALVEYAKEGQGVFITPSAMSGLTAPDSIASLLLLNNTEVLPGVVLTQLINPGTPVVYGIQSHGSDIRYTVPTVGSPEQCLIFYAVKELGNFYGIPVRTGGSSGDAKQVDMQAGVESFATCFATLHSGADIMIHSCGGMDSDNTLSYDKYIYDEEVIQSVQRILKGVEVNEETLLYDKIKKAGPGGNFLGRTSRTYRDNYIFLDIPNRLSHSNWITEGAESITQRTKKAYEKRIEEFVMPELDKKQQAIIDKYIPEDFRVR